MEYKVNIPGFEGRQIILKCGGFFSGPSLKVDGRPAQKGKKKGDLLLVRNDGTKVVVRLNIANFLDPVPQVVVNGKKLKVVEPLKWYQWAWAGAPILLIFIGGFVGGLIGGLAAAVNGKVLRSDMNEISKYALTGIVSVVAIIGFLILAALIGTLLQE